MAIMMLSQMVNDKKMTLRDGREIDIDVVRYADDGIIFSNEEIDHIGEQSEQLVSEGSIKYSAEKSGWIVKNKKWIKPLKFLGLEFDGENLRANTRKGSTLIMDKNDLLEALAYRQKTGQSPGVDMAFKNKFS